MKSKIIITLLATSIFYCSAQETIRKTCTTPTHALEKSKEYYRNNMEHLSKTKKRPGTNTRAYTQSIHNTIVKWDGGSYNSFRIGTAPGLQDIKWGQGLGAASKHTGGQSYEELRKSALDLGTTFSIGDIFYITMDAGSASEWVSPPLKFEWENLGVPSNEVTIQVETNYGVNGASSYTIAERDKMMAFYNLVNPIIKEIYGPPSRNHEVYIVNDGNSIGTNTFYNGPNQISSSFELNNNTDKDLDQPRLMIHEIVHAYRDNLTVSSDDEWHYETTLSGFEEGMAEAVAILVMDTFIDRYPNFFNGNEYKIHWSHSRGMPFDWDYDFQNHSQLTTTDFFSSDIGTGAHWERYGTSQAAMQKMYIEDHEVFKKFNTEYYKRLNANHSLIPSRDLVIDILKSILEEVEGTPTEDWINDQRIFDCKVIPGNKVHMLTFHSVSPPRIHTNDNRLHIYQTQNLPDGNEWSWDKTDALNNANSERWYIQTNNIDGQLQIFNYDNSLHQEVIIKNNKRRMSENLPPDLGPYQGGNLIRYNGIFTGNDGANDCTQPGCGKRPALIESHNFRSTSTTDRNHSDLPSNLPDPNSQIISGLSDLGLYKYDISFEGGNYSGTYYRLHGTDLVRKNGIVGGIKSKDDSKLITGKLIIEHEDFGEEADVVINNGAFISSRDWASVLETETHRQGGRTDRHYSIPGKVHAIYISEDCAEQKIDFRNIRYGDGLNGSQMFLFTVENFQTIEFKTENTISLCEGDPLTLMVENNFPNILDTDSRISYKWIGPDNNEIATGPNYTIPSTTEAMHNGTYTLEIDFFGCPIIFQPEVSVNSTGFAVSTPEEINLCQDETLELETNIVIGATYNWTGPNEFSANTRQISIPNITTKQEGEYIVEVTALDCNGIPATKTSNTTITIDSSVELSDLPAEVSLCVGDNFTQEIEALQNTSYTWNGPNNYTSQERILSLNNLNSSNQGTYTILVSTEACGLTVEKTQSISIVVEACKPDILIPGYFTPNGDGFNDTWIISQEQAEFKYINIFDRYGKLLTQLTPSSNGWDGYYNGQQMPSSEYWFLIHFTDNSIQKGHFSLIR